MNAVLIILNLLVLIGIVVIVVFVRSYLPSYAKEKGKNLATKEDISDITNKIEKIRSQHTSQLERLKIDLGVLSKKHGILLDEKVRVFKELQRRLVAFKRYCECALGEFYGGEFHLCLDSLPENIDKTTLLHLTALYYLEQDNYIFLTENARSILEKLRSQMNSMCSMELQRIGAEDDSDLKSSVADVYMSAMENVDKCLVELYKDLQMPDAQ